jgi:hypothetical protein
MKMRLVAGLLIVGVALAAEPVRFNRDIRPIMSDTCFRCHGPDARARQAGLRLDQRDEALKQSKTGVTPIVPGDPDKSAIVRRVFAMNATVMPPRAIHKELTAAQKETIRQWVKEGATYEGHWAWQPVQRPAVPQVAGATTPIDAFIRERLAREGLKPSPEADKRTLLRRVTLDLTGVPPTPEEFAAFVADKSNDAYERAVDRLLQKPGYAETQARYWLDAVRYADSAGFHGDNLWPAWPYRDYVLRAFRDNMPFDRFTREQLAGDLMPNATVDQKVASAYNRLNRVSAEGGLQPKEYLAKYGADRVRTLSTVWMGATLGCAECHDHKFDPFSSKDFYSMKAFFADIKESGLVSDRGGSAWGSKLALPTEAQTQELKAIDEQLEAARRALQTSSTETSGWEQRILADHASGALAWKYQRPLSATSTGGAVLKIFNDEQVDFNYYLNGSLASERKPGGGLIIASGANPDNPAYTVTFKPGVGTWTALGIEIQQDESLPGNRLSRGADRFVITEVEADHNGQKLSFVLATSTQSGEWPENPAMAAIDRDARSGWGVGYGEHRNAFLALRLAKSQTTTADSVITIRIRHDSTLRRATIGRFRVALSSGLYSLPEPGESGRKKRMAKPDEATVNVATDRGLTPEIQKALETKEAERTAPQRKALLEHYQWTQLGPLVERVARFEAQRALIDAAIPRVLYTETVTPAVTRILPRANWMDETNEIVAPALPAFLGKVAVSERRATRLDLADWIVSRDNPLTARVFVNRLWRQFFGTGLSKVLEDLGSQGEWPTHPELLDWLASEFMNKWDVKHVIRTIVTSQTYRQSSAGNSTLDERDPENRLLARQTRFRVDAEAVHDVALSVSGLLVERFGGPSVKPYGPDGYLAGMNFPKREYSSSRGDDLHRRALYTQWQRTFLHPSLLTMDAPTREECSVNRVNSNTPLQALELLNDPIFVEAARVFAQNILKSGGATFDARLNWAFTRALNRAANPDERKILSGLYQKSLAHFRATPAAANEFAAVGEAPTPAILNRADVAATAMVARAILNLHETITRN